MDIFAAYAVDENLEVNGTWMEVGDAKFLVARSGNKNYVKALSKAVERNRKALNRRDDEADKLSDKLMAEVIAKTILLGWEGVKYQGKPLEYNAENAVMVLKHPEFRKEIMQLADDFDQFKAQKEAEEEKN